MVEFYMDDDRVHVNEGVAIRTKWSHPYSYDPIVQFRTVALPAANNTVYTDRMYQWDYKKYNALCEKHFGNTVQYWDKRDPKTTEAFLTDYLTQEGQPPPVVKVRTITEYCNQSTGFPTWRIDYFQEK